MLKAKGAIIFSSNKKSCSLIIFKELEFLKKWIKHVWLST